MRLCTPDQIFEVNDYNQLELLLQEKAENSCDQLLQSMTRLKLDVLQKEDELGLSHKFKQLHTQVQGHLKGECEESCKLIEIETRLLEAIHHRRMGNQQDSQVILEQIQSEIPDLNISPSVKELIHIHITKELAHTYLNSPEVGKSIELLEELVEILRPRSEFQLLADVLSLLGVANRNIGHLEDSYQYQFEALQLRKQLDNKRDLAYSYYQMGGISIFMGKFQEAFEYHLKSMKIRKKLGDMQDLAASYGALGEYYSRLGRYGKAEFYLQRALDLRKQIDKPTDIGFSYISMAKNLRSQARFDDAIDLFQKAERIGLENQNLMLFGSSIFDLSQLLHQQHRMDELQELYQVVKTQVSTTKHEHNHLLRVMKEFIQALVLSRTKRSTTLGKAQTIFTRLAHGKWSPEFVKLASNLYLSELLLSDLRAYGSPEILQELTATTDRLISLATEQHVFQVLIEAYLIKSKLALLENDLEMAQALLDDAESTAEYLGIDPFIERVAEEKSNLLGEIERWTKIITEETSLVDKLDLTQIEEMVMQLIRQKSTTLDDLDKEEGVMVLIILPNGTTLISIPITSQSLINEQLIGGFISAINSFSSEALSSDGSIEQIKHKDYTLMINPVDDLLFTYVFRGGQSYMAGMKLQEFITELKNHDELWVNITNGIKTGKISKKIQQEMKELSITYFT